MSTKHLSELCECDQDLIESIDKDNDDEITGFNGYISPKIQKSNKERNSTQ